VGSSNIGTGTRRQMIKSILEKLMNLPEETIIYPGHGSATTIKEEKVNNPRLYANDYY
jgi:glyoxylase-like metal-dependent hydrolase (beta-lactamase superfamily II)